MIGYKQMVHIPYIYPIGNGTEARQIALTNTDRHFLSTLLRMYLFDQNEAEIGSGDYTYVKGLIQKIER